MIVGGEKSFCFHDVVQMLAHRPGDAQPVQGARSPSDLIEDHQTLRGRVVQDQCSFIHLDEKGALPTSQIIPCTDPSKDTVQNRKFCLFGRNKRTRLRQETNQRGLPKVGAFSRHIRPGQHDQRTLVFSQMEIIRHKRFCPSGQKLFHHRMPTANDMDLAIVSHNGTHIAPSSRGRRQPTQRIQGTQ